MGVLAVDRDQGRYGGSSTIDDVEAIVDELHRYELIEGELVVTPPPGPWHQDVVYELFKQLIEPCERRGLRLRDNRGVLFADETMIIPDLVVYREGPPARGVYLTPDQIALVVEVVSRSSRKRDQFVKPSLLATYGVPLYLLVDPFPRPSRLTLYRLDGSDYEDFARVEAGTPLRLPKPFDLEIETTPLA
jgi:Uma2 family endonuclease